MFGMQRALSSRCRHVATGLPWTRTFSAVAPVKADSIYIMGGLGTRASLDTVQKLVDMCSAVRHPCGDMEFVRFVLDSHPDIHWVPSSQDETARLCTDVMRRGLDRASSHATATGYKLITCCACNTAHGGLKDVAVPSNISFLHIAEATRRDLDWKIKKYGLQDSKVILWSTTGTANFGFYQERMPSLAVPDTEQAEVVHDIISNVKSGLMPKAIDLAEGEVAKMPRGTIIIMGCTELPLVVPELMKRKGAEGIHFIDPNLALARHALLACMEPSEYEACFEVTEP